MVLVVSWTLWYWLFLGHFHSVMEVHELTAIVNIDMNPDAAYDFMLRAYVDLLVAHKAIHLILHGNPLPNHRVLPIPGTTARELSGVWGGRIVS